MRLTAVAFVAAGLFAVPAWAQPTSGTFDELTLRKLEEALACVNLSPADLGWDKRPISDAWRLRCVDETLDHPLMLSGRAERAEREFAGDPAASARAAFPWLDCAPPAAEAPAAETSVELPGAPPEAAALLAVLIRARRDAEALRTRAFVALNDAEWELLRQRGEKIYTDESEEDWDMTPILAAAGKIELRFLLAAGVVLADAAARVLADAARLDPAAWKSQSWNVEGVTVALGGPGPDAHSAQVVLDGGGDDAYAASCTAVADLAGDDVYRGACAGLHAVALLVDLAGNDRYAGGDFVQGSAAYGASLLLDVAGDDRYEANQCSQGSGFFGVGMLFDLAGQDMYRGARFVQAFGGIRGLGVLSDLTGDDVYYAGGKYRHAPLLPENYQSLSQGFGFGLRGANASGGIGILADHAGNDVYAAEVFAQGASYWFSLGILVDSAGHDKYVLYQYGQGSGIHLSSAILFDRAGNDAYSCNYGVAQGCGHDWAVGILWDLAGDDYYQGSGMTQGGANANGIGILVDRAGNDAYSGRTEVQGWSFESRGTIGLGLMLDLGGTDHYTSGGKDDSIWTKSAVGVGLDWTERPAEEKKQ